MITAVDLPRDTMQPGETRILRIDAAAPISVAIRCFATSPPPPGYRPCPECGTFIVTAGQPVEIHASALTFEEGGYLQVAISDADGDTRQIKLHVEGETPGTSSEMARAY